MSKTWKNITTKARTDNPENDWILGNKNPWLSEGDEREKDVEMREQNEPLIFERMNASGKPKLTNK